MSKSKTSTKVLRDYVDDRDYIITYRKFINDKTGEVQVEEVSRTLLFDFVNQFADQTDINKIVKNLTMEGRQLSGIPKPQYGVIPGMDEVSPLSVFESATDLYNNYKNLPDNIKAMYLGEDGKPSYEVFYKKFDINKVFQNVINEHIASLPKKGKEEVK
jgi:hypothetical protein